MKTNLRIAILFTVVTTVLFGLSCPLGVTGLAQLLFPSKANGSLLTKDGKLVGSRLIGQSFSGAAYFQPRLSNAGNGYDASQSSGSGLDPEISPAAAEFQVPRVARERKLTEADVRALVQKHTLRRQFGFLGEPRVRVLELNLDLDANHPRR